jgi:hypothetical protein
MIVMKKIVHFATMLQPIEYTFDKGAETEHNKVIPTQVIHALDVAGNIWEKIGQMEWQLVQLPSHQKAKS